MKYQFEPFPATGGYNLLANADNLHTATTAPINARGHYTNHTARSNAAQSDTEIGYYKPNAAWDVETASFEFPHSENGGEM